MKHRSESLYELAELVHALARHLPPPAGLLPGPCTPLEIIVVKFVGQNPGTFSGAAAKATRLPTSNFSRIVNSLVAKGLVTRVVDDRDARNVHLYPTELAAQNRALMRDAWSAALSATSANDNAIEALNAMLRQIEAELAARSKVSSREPNALAIPPMATAKTSIVDQE